jgi:hypothetical protein
MTLATADRYVNPREREHGFSCPDCGARMWTKDSRPAMFDGRPSIRRRRLCSGCGIKITTFEAIARPGESRIDRRLSMLIVALRGVATSVAATLQIIEAVEAEREGNDQLAPQQRTDE